MSLCQELYDSEINAEIKWFWDDRFEVSIGDPLNGFKEHTNVDTWPEVEQWLRAKAIEYWPDSVFAKSQP